MQDLGRLNKEKQTLEEQIADLFAFLSKQKEKQGVETEVSVSWLAEYLATRLKVFLFGRPLIGVSPSHCVNVHRMLLQWS